MNWAVIFLTILGILAIGGLLLAWAAWRGREVPPPEPGPAPEPAPDFEAQLGPIWRPGKEK